MTSAYQERMVRVDEKIKGLYKIITANSKQVDQNTWTLDQEISWAALNEYLGLNVIPGEVIPYETCMRILGEFTGLGPDWDNIPKEGLELMKLIDTIQNHIRPTVRNLAMKNEFSYSSFESLRNNNQKQHTPGVDFKGVHLEAGIFDGITPNRNGRIYPKSDLGKTIGNLNGRVFTDMECSTLDVNKLLESLKRDPTKVIQINKEDLLNINVEDAYPKPGSPDIDLSRATELYLTRRRHNKLLRNPEYMTDDERRAFSHLQYQLSGSTGSGEHCLVGEVSDYAHIPDAFPDVVYSEEQLEPYAEHPWLTPGEATAIGIVVRLYGKPLHPRHWRYAAGNGFITFLDNEIDTEKVEVETGDLSELRALRFLPKWMRVGMVGGPAGTPAYKLSLEIMERFQADIDAGKIKVVIVHQRISVDPSWDALYANFRDGVTVGDFKVLGVNTLSGMARSFRVPDHINFEDESKGNVPTVRGNSRQKLIDNGKRTWPEPKKRPGYRTKHFRYK